MGKLHTPVCVLGKQAWLRAGRSAFIPLTQKQNLRWEAEGGTSGLEAWNCPNRQPYRPQLGADWSFAGSRVSPGPCSQLIAQIKWKWVTACASKWGWWNPLRSACRESPAKEPRNFWQMERARSWWRCLRGRSRGEVMQKRTKASGWKQAATWWL